ncbi:hypothetical protein J3R03_004994 [Actinoplanes couchii]|uniref:hypothetical protein n=1 Tax=Actinoplanes couchii TaxID=403638 RepID=UPI0028631E2A|nr:hypothetical protein [Actinoplanes couchii]MDR6320798.1 hypothetical protein [Actinoplanes couchii]
MGWQVAARETGRRVVVAGWRAVDPGDREWPRTGLRRNGTIRVGKAWAFEAGGFPVIAEEISWTGNALSGATEETDGTGSFVVIRLPVDAPSMAFRLTYRLLGEVPPGIGSAVRRAFAAERIPAWTVTGPHLFTVESHSDWAGPDRLDVCVRRALLVPETATVAVSAGDNGGRPGKPGTTAGRGRRRGLRAAGPGTTGGRAGNDRRRGRERRAAGPGTTGGGAGDYG